VEAVQAVDVLEQHAPRCVQTLGEQEVPWPEKKPPEVVQAPEVPKVQAAVAVQQAPVAAGSDGT
jgi:hypothetical protein